MSTDCVAAGTLVFPQYSGGAWLFFDGAGAAITPSFSVPASGGLQNIVFLDDGRSLQNGGASNSNNLNVYSSALALLGSQSGDFSAASSDHSTAFYVKQGNDLKKISPTDGSTLQTWSGILSGANAFAISPDGSKVYYGKNAGAGADARKIFVYDLVALSGPTDFCVEAASNVNFASGPAAIICLRNGSVLAAWNDFITFSPDTRGYVRVYSSAGVQGIRIELTAGGDDDYVSALSAYLNDTTFVMISYDVSADAIVVERRNVSDGTVVSTFTKTGSPAYDSMFAGFGVLALATGNCVAATTPPPSSQVLNNSTPCCGSSGSSGSATGPKLPAISADWTPVCAGGGSVPTQADLTDAESWL